MEGPSLVILKEEMKRFVGKTVLAASGYTKIGIESFPGQKLKWIKTWGKHYLMKIGDVTFRTHFMLWGTYTIDSRKDRNPTLRLEFENGESNFYSSAIRLIEEPLDELYDWSVDVMSAKWDPKHVRKLVKQDPKRFVADVILDQSIFSGAGNIIKNEVLYNLRLYPETRISKLKPREITALVDEVRSYSKQFYRWKKKYVLRKHWLVYKKGTCPNCGGKLKRGPMGKGQRYTYWCPVCQAKR